ncbi:MAG: hypothetical protein RLZZ573_1130 [Pseudomonadota bacterium]|jgi:hypothetical protein
MVIGRDCMLPVRSAEGATAPETLRQKGPITVLNSEELPELVARHTAGASAMATLPRRESLRYQTEGAYAAHGARQYLLPDCLET